MGEDDAAYVLQSLKTHDPARYLAALYLPATIRDDVATLWAFDAEIARIPEFVSQPLPGEIRLRWWRDLLSSGDNSGSGPLAHALIQTIERHKLPREVLYTYLEARIFDLYQDPMPDQGTFEGYLGETVSSFFQLAAICTGAEHSRELAEACGHAGMAFGLSRLLEKTAMHRSQGQVFFPLDSLVKFELTRESWLSNPDERHAGVIAELVVLAQEHLAKARKALGGLESDHGAVFLPQALVEPTLKQITKAAVKTLEVPQSLSPIHRHWALFRAAMRKIP